MTKEIIDQEKIRGAGDHGAIHLWKEGSFLRAYDWSAWLCCHYLHEFKVTKRQFKGFDEAVIFIGFPETSLAKWTPEGSEQEVVTEKHLVSSDSWEVTNHRKCSRKMEKMIIFL